MKAILMEADWAPKPSYKLTEWEATTHKMWNGSNAFKYPKVRLVDIPKPEPKDDELLVKVKACGYCGSDMHSVEAGPDGYMLYTAHVTSPVVLGHEFSGIVEAVGRDVVGFEVGDMIAPEEMQWCGECLSCRRGVVNQCLRLEELGLTLNGGMAEYVAIKAKHCWKINSLVETYGGDMDKVFEAGALVEPTGVAYNALFIESRGIKPGDNVAVLGAGPIGLAAIHLFRAAGAAKILAFEVNANRSALAKQMGANHVYNPVELEKEGKSAADVMLEHTDAYGVEMMLDVTGMAHVIFPGPTKGMARDGQTVVAGLGPDPATINLLDLVGGGSCIQGSCGHAGNGIFGRVINLMASGRINMLPTITHRVTLDEAIDAFERLHDRNDAKVMIRM